MNKVTGLTHTDSPAQANSFVQAEPTEHHGRSRHWPRGLAILAIALLSGSLGYQIGVAAMRQYIVAQLKLDVDDQIFDSMAPDSYMVLEAIRAARYQNTPFESAGVFAMRIVVTLAIMTAALYVILARKSGRYPPSDRKWAYAALAAIMAFWLAVGAL